MSRQPGKLDGGTREQKGGEQRRWDTHKGRSLCSPNNSSLMSLAACNPSSLRFRSICRLRARAARSSADIAQPIFRPTFARAEIFTRAAIIRAPVAGWVATRDDDDDDDEVPPRRSPTVNRNGAAPVLCRSSGPSPAAVRAVMVTHVPGGCCCCCSCAVQLLLSTTPRAGTDSTAVGLADHSRAGRAGHSRGHYPFGHSDTDDIHGAHAIHSLYALADDGAEDTVKKNKRTRPTKPVDGPTHTRTWVNNTHRRTSTAK